MLRYSTFNILRSSSMGGLHLKYLNTLLWSPKSQPVVGELQSICKGGWVGGRTVKSENNTNFVLPKGWSVSSGTSVAIWMQRSITTFSLNINGKWRCWEEVPAGGNLCRPSPYCISFSTSFTVFHYLGAVLNHILDYQI